MKVNKMVKKPRENRVPIMMSEEELQAIDDWRFENRIATRSDAIRRLCKIGLVADQELDQIVDIASNGVSTLVEQSADIATAYKSLVNFDTENVLFGRSEVIDILDLAFDHADVAERGMIGLHAMLVTLFGIINSIVDAATLSDGMRESERRIAEASEATENAIAKQKEREENRYISIHVNNESSEQREVYEKLSDEEKDKFWEGRIAELKALEEADPEDFAKRFDIAPPFWEQPGWLTRLQERFKRKENGEVGRDGGRSK
ncbi:hypothetical protein E3C22_03480 [Jiella endophytica]|uniref:Ribbon-helix-helix protein, CopG family n=1 Tax=Jiella endophytica TaxID=2558362 RepID=A0A4Y8RUU7_9HYPH|nr:hypothetical protein [Jiella endophytica]TFF27532.1 hypothetical protein E3C22_03480 [Jiella endophytica]